MRILPVTNYGYINIQPQKTKNTPSKKQINEASLFSVPFCAHPHLNSVSYAEAREIINKKYEKQCKILNNMGIENCPKPKMEITRMKKVEAYYLPHKNTIRINNSFFKEKSLYFMVNKNNKPQLYYEDDSPVLVFFEGMSNTDINDIKPRQKITKRYLTHEEVLAFLSLVIEHEMAHYSQNIIMLQNKNAKEKIAKNLLDLTAEQSVSTEEQQKILEEQAPFFAEYSPTDYKIINTNLYDLDDGTKYPITQDYMIDKVCDSDSDLLEADANLTMYEYANSKLREDFPALKTYIIEPIIDYSEECYLYDMESVRNSSCQTV